jgi:hemerythrin
MWKVTEYKRCARHEKEHQDRMRKLAEMRAKAAQSLCPECRAEMERKQREVVYCNH